MPTSESMQWADSRNRLCSFCRNDMELKLAKKQNRKPNPIS